MFCGGCGVRIPEGAGFCPACGWKVDPSFDGKPEEVRRKGIGKNQAFGISFLVSFIGSVPGLITGLVAAVVAVFGIYLASKDNEDLVPSSVMGAALGLAVGTAVSIVIFLLVFGSITGFFGLRRSF